uniref:Uncharacterized protein n=1 Tax=Manihot esculenta TaxID=3983 RepID=A0A2C9WM03_MANES
MIYNSHSTNFRHFGPFIISTQPTTSLTYPQFVIQSLTSYKRPLLIHHHHHPHPHHYSSQNSLQSTISPPPNKIPAFFYFNSS